MSGDRAAAEGASSLRFCNGITSSIRRQEQISPRRPPERLEILYADHFSCMKLPCFIVIWLMGVYLSGCYDLYMSVCLVVDDALCYVCI